MGKYKSIKHDPYFDPEFTYKAREQSLETGYFLFGDIRSFIFNIAGDYYMIQIDQETSKESYHEDDSKMPIYFYFDINHEDSWQLIDCDKGSHKNVKKAFKEMVERSKLKLTKLGQLL